VDVRLARDRITELAQWWTQATQEARFEILRQATKENVPSLALLRIAIILAESEAGQIEEG
jgi:hypothetical protein